MVVIGSSVKGKPWIEKGEGAGSRKAEWNELLTPAFWIPRISGFSSWSC